jgi:hypothetical protein
MTSRIAVSLEHPDKLAPDQHWYRIENLEDSFTSGWDVVATNPEVALERILDMLCFIAGGELEIENDCYIVLRLEHGEPVETWTYDVSVFSEAPCVEIEKARDDDPEDYE